MLRKCQRHWEEQEEQGEMAKEQVPSRQGCQTAAEAAGVRQAGNLSHVGTTGPGVLAEKTAASVMPSDRFQEARLP